MVDPDPPLNLSDDERAKRKLELELLELEERCRNLSEERKKIVADTRLANEELGSLGIARNKLSLETMKLEDELKHAKGARGQERIRTYGTMFSGIVALVAIATVVVSIWSGIEESRFKKESAVAGLLKDLGAPAGATRASAALALGPYFSEQKLRSEILSALISALTLEYELVVQYAISEAIDQAARTGMKSDPLTSADTARRLQKAINMLNTEIIPLFTDLNVARQLETKSQAKGSKDLQYESARVREIERKIEGRQRAAVTAAILVQRLNVCGEPVKRDCEVCPIDLSGAALRGFKFVGMRENFCGAKFDKASLGEYDFYEINLTQATFVAAKIHGASFRKANLRDADFSDADARFDENNPTRRAIFIDANTDRAKFHRACLGAADLSKTKVALETSQLVDASLVGARLQNDLQVKVLVDQTGKQREQCTPYPRWSR